ncbi:MAG: hypothetical protein KAJ15_11450 [Spirochaetes bacterium]|nr:hypothetical protein [Spirochaetota bacterium]
MVGIARLCIALALSAGGPLTGEAGIYLKKIMAMKDEIRKIGEALKNLENR